MGPVSRTMPAAARRVFAPVRPVWFLAALTGAATGLLVAGFERVVGDGLFDRVLRLPVAVQIGVPTVGLGVAALALRLLAGGASPATADEYIRTFHERDRRMPLRPVMGRILAGAATLGSGGAMGFEGLSMYMGAATGTAVQQRLARYFRRDEAKVLLVSGAAAGVAAIFKAPATGAVFALEVPYQDDLARHMLLPVLFSAAAGYVTFVAVNGTEPLFPVSGSPPIDLRDLGGAALLGLACGLCAQVFARLVRLAKSLAGRGHPAVRVGVAGSAIGAAVALGHAVSGDTLVLGSGYRSISWALEPGHAVSAVAVVFVLRALATSAAVAGGGAGGLFVPLVVQGALLGRIAGTAVNRGDTTLFPLLGVAAFLGAGYRVPLAAVMFVAESTGKPGFVVPALIAAATAQLGMGRWSVSAYQHAARAGHLERRIDLPLTSVLRTDAATVPPDATMAEFFAHHVLAVHLTTVPVVDGSTYLGMVHLDDLGAVPRERWDTTPVSVVARTDDPVAEVAWTLGEALTALDRADTDRLAVVDQGGYVGIVTTGEMLKLDEILDVAEDGGPASVPGVPPA